MTTTLDATPQPTTASVLLTFHDTDSPATVYSQGWESGLDSWALLFGTARTRVAGAGRGGGYALQVTGPGAAGVNRVITGLIAGRSYRATVWGRNAADGSPTLTLDAGTPVDLLTGAWTQASYTFTAGTTSHDLQIYMDGPATLAVNLDDVQVDLLPVAGYDPNLFQILRTDANGTRPVRLLPDQIPVNGDLVVTDYEPALAGLLTYTVTSGVTGAAPVTDSTTLDGVTEPRLSVAVGPQYTATPTLVTGFDAGRTSGATVHRVIGRADPLPTLGVLGTREGRLDIYAGTYAGVLEVVAVYAQGDVVLFRQPWEAGLDLYHIATSVGEVVEVGPDVWRVTVEFVEVAAPTGPLTGALGWTFDVVAVTYATFAQLASAYPTFADLTIGPPS